MDVPNRSSQANVASRTNGARATPWARGADWAVGVVAAVLLLISLSGWLYHRAQLADIAAEHLRLQVTGPAKLRKGMTNQFVATTTSVMGEPVSAQVDFSLYAPDGKRLMGHKEKTDQQGRLRISIPADLVVPDGSKMEVIADNEDREQILARLLSEPVLYATRLTLDKPAYRPGETIHYRSLTLSRFGLKADRDVALQFEILDPAGTPVEDLRSDIVGRRGLAGGRFTIPDGIPGGRYTLAARSPQGVFPEARETFVIRRYRLPRLVTRLEFARRGYLAGEVVTAEFSAHRAHGGPAAGARLGILATVDGKVIYQREAEASELGSLDVEFSLPEEIRKQEGRLVVVVDDGGVRETLTEAIPINSGKTKVEFYPEGGHLVAGLQNRVYFAARDHFGEPVDIRGRVVDSQGRPVAMIQTTHRGMGAMGIVPALGEEYRLQFEGSTDLEELPRLPRVSSEQEVSLNTGIGVFDAGKPLQFNVRAATAGLPLVASAWCRGVPAGQQAFVTKVDANPVEIALDNEVAGVIRLTIYDYRSSPPRAVAERLVYRRSSRSLEVKVSQNGGQLLPGETVDVSLSVTNELGRPTPATLAASIVDDAHSSLSAAPAMRPATYFLLATEIEDPNRLNDVDFYLSEDSEAAVALDLLLGTQGWRRFLEDKLREVEKEGRHDEQLLRLAALGARANPPAMFDNLIELHQRYKENLDTYRAKRTRTSETLTTLSFFGGAGLVVLVAMLNLLNIASGARLWAPAIGVATICLIIGGIWMNPKLLKSAPDGSVPYVPFDLETHGQPPAETPENKDANATGEGSREDAATEHTKSHTPLDGVSSTGEDGKTRINLRLPERPTNARVIIDAHDGNGRLGWGQSELAVHLPLELMPIVPSEVTVGDRIDLPLAVANNTDERLLVELDVEHGSLVRSDHDARDRLEVEPQCRGRQSLSLEVIGRAGTCELTFRGAAGQLSDEVASRLTVVPPESSDSGSRALVGDEACPVQLSTQLDKTTAVWGTTLMLSVKLINLTDTEQPTTAAVLGLPAGLEVRTEHLARLRQIGTIDYYQTGPRKLVLYLRKLAPNQEVELNVELIAAIPGKYTGPASRVYLNTPTRLEHWNEPLSVEITCD